MIVEISEMTGEPFKTVTVDRETCTISGMSLLSPRSKNGRFYTEPAVADAVRLYEGAQYFVDHPTESENKDRQGVRSMKSLVGGIKNVRMEGTFPDCRVHGDVVLLPAHPMAGQIMDIAEHQPQLAGNSHRVYATLSKGGDGTENVNSIDRVLGMELVSDPATTMGMFESNANNKPGTTEDEPMTLAELKERHPEIYSAAIAEQTVEIDKLTVRVGALDTENVALKTKVETFESIDAAKTKTELIAAKVKAAGLPEYAMSDTFQESLMAAADDAGIDALIADRKSVSGGRTIKHPEKIVNEQDGDFADVTSESLAEASRKMFA
jgi:hypothetical protein